MDTSKIVDNNGIGECGGLAQFGRDCYSTVWKSAVDGHIDFEQLEQL